MPYKKNPKKEAADLDEVRPKPAPCPLTLPPLARPRVQEEAAGGGQEAKGAPDSGQGKGPTHQWRDQKVQIKLNSSAPPSNGGATASCTYNRRPSGGSAGWAFYRRHDQSPDTEGDSVLLLRRVDTHNAGLGAMRPSPYNEFTL